MRYLLSVFLAIALAGCDSGDGPAASNGNPAAKPSDAENQSLRQSSVKIAPDFAHAKDVRAKRGDFRFYPETLFCQIGLLDQKLALTLYPDDTERALREFRTRTSINQASLAEKGLSIGTPDGNRSNREAFVKKIVKDTKPSLFPDPECSNNGKNIIITHFIHTEKGGGSYAMTMSIRQGELYWSKSIARQPRPLSHELGMNALLEQTDVDSRALQAEMNRVLLGESG